MRNLYGVQLPAHLAGSQAAVSRALREFRYPRKFAWRNGTIYLPSCQTLAAGEHIHTHLAKYIYRTTSSTPAHAAVRLLDDWHSDGMA